MVIALLLVALLLILGICANSADSQAAVVIIMDCSVVFWFNTFELFDYFGAGDVVVRYLGV